jgi:two-component sensor histidine kinase
MQRFFGSAQAAVAGSNSASQLRAAEPAPGSGPWPSAGPEAHTSASATPRAWRVPPLRAIGWALLFAVLLSTQFLAQPFVWRNFPLLEVLEGWAYVARDRAVVALTIAAVVVLFGHARIASLGWRAAWLAAAIALGALGGEALVRALDGRSGFDVPTSELAGHAARWGLMAGVLASMAYLWQAAARTRAQAQHELLQRVRAEQQLTEARLTALHSQIEPHFLFNTLATVRRLQRTGPAAGAHMLANFVGYLRHTLALLNQREVRLDAELELVQAYLAVIQVRMSGRLVVQIDVPASLHALLLPPLALATLVENAVKHGLTPAPDGGTLNVRARQHGGNAELSVEDTGVGFGVGATGGSGLGLSNVRARLKTLHGSTASLRLAANVPRGVRATIELPLRLGSGEEIS